MPGGAEGGRRAKRELLERALARLGGAGPGRRASTSCARSPRPARRKRSPPTRRRSRRRSPAPPRPARAASSTATWPSCCELFSARFEAAKERRAGIDFEDLQILAARLLERAEIGEHYRARFRQILVDEFQDTNRLQLRLIEALRGPKTELVVVGDELQSIYGFRHADLDVFRRRREEIDRRADAELMRLSGNFRSRPEVVGAVNLFGEALLGEAYKPLRVGAAVRGALAPAEPAVELLLTARDGWDGEGIELEPAIDGATPLNCLAEARVRRRAAARSWPMRGCRAARWSCCCAPSPTSTPTRTRSNAPACAPTSSAAAATGPSSRSPTSAPCWRSIANPLDDHALFGALASPACARRPGHALAAARRGRASGATSGRRWSGQRARARRSWPSPSGWRRSRRPSGSCCATFAGRIASLRERGAAALAAGADRGGGDRDRLRPRGAQRGRPARRASPTSARWRGWRPSSSQREGRDLRGFLDFLAARAESDAEAQAATAAEGHDGVRIMTVHNAKGLEFGVVAVPDLARSLLAGGRAPLLVARPRGAAAGGAAAAPPRQPPRSTSTTTARSARRRASATPRRGCASSTSPPPAPASG